MPASPLGRIVHRLAAPAVPDGELVRRFADARCELAFAELVRRHGPAVYGVCRRALGDHHLAEDAFQAVFVVLARKAGDVRPPGAVGGWLYGVARKAAAEAAAMRRRKRREHLPGAPPDRPAAAPEPDDTAATVDAAIAGLPAPLRSAVLLCEIEGLPRAKAAARLGIAEGTLSSRLAKARKVLADRLRRRGLAGLAVAVPAALAGAAAGRADGCAAGDVLELANGVLRTMLATKLRLAPVWVLCAVVAASGALLAITPHTPAGPRTSPQAPPAAPAPRPPEWKLLFTLEHTHRVTAVAVWKDLIAVAAETGPSTEFRLMRFWNASDGKETDLEVTWHGLNKPVRFLRTTAGEADLVEGAPEGATKWRRRPGGIASDTLGSYDLLACSPDLNTLLIHWTDNFKGKPNQVYLHVNPWAVKENFLKELAVFEEDRGAVTHADVSPDDRRFALAGDDAVIRVYSRKNLGLLHKITLPKQTKLTAVRLSGHGRLAVVGEAGFAKLFDDVGAEVCDLRGHEGTVAAVAFTPEGRQVVTAAGGVVRMFDATTGKPVATLAAHKEVVNAVAFSPDGKRLVTGSVDKTAKVWTLKD